MPTLLLKKMSATINPEGVVCYQLGTPDEPIPMNCLLGKEVELRFTGTIRCVACGKITKKSFGQGYCYPCFISVPETEDCVLKPHLCQAHLGIARNMDYAADHCLIDHYVYLALSGGLKVGVTRNTQIPTRWIDQGASQGLVVARTPNRHLAGTLEVELMKFFSDKTNWRHMLTNVEPTISLLDEREKLKNLVAGSLSQYLTDSFDIQQIAYPVAEYPNKVTSLNFDKTSVVEGVIQGMRGQYLIFDGGRVINLRTFTGYEVEVTF